MQWEHRDQEVQAFPMVGLQWTVIRSCYTSKHLPGGQEEEGINSGGGSG